MACERVKFDQISVKLGFLGVFALIGVPSSLYGWLASGESVVGVALAVVSFVIALVIWEVRRNNARLKAAMEAFKQRGYQLDVQMGTLLIDSKAKVLAFVNLGQRTMDYYTTHDILEWEHQWVDRTNVSVVGGFARATTNQTQNAVVVKTNNPHSPMYRLPCIGHSMGQRWMAQLSAVLNG